MYRNIVLSSVLFSILTACQIPISGPLDRPKFEAIESGQDFPAAVPASFDATLGWLSVPEDRSDSQSPEVRLPVAIIHAKSVSNKSPVVYLAGGPGTAAMRTAAFPGAYPWLEDRDFIVIGQRGTHYAKPALMCPEYRDAVAANSDLVASVRACRARLEATDVRLETYNSVTSAADLEALRQALEIESWSLYGGSYGTRLALIYAKIYGANVDSMVLDSPLPPNAIYDDESTQNFENALRAVARDCAAQPSCAAAFPALEERFFQTIVEVSTSPLEIAGFDQTVTAPGLASLVPLASEGGVRRAPMMMDKVAKLDRELLNASVGPPQASDFAWGMRFSVWCSEALPFSERSNSENPGKVLGGYESAAIDPELCDAWAVPAMDPSFTEPVVSNVPTLIIAGEFDPLTPPKWGELAAKTLPNSKVVTIRGGSHSSTQQWGGDGCAMSISADFLDAPEAFLMATASDNCASSRAAPIYQVSRE